MLKWGIIYAERKYIRFELNVSNDYWHNDGKKEVQRDCNGRTGKFHDFIIYVPITSKNTSNRIRKELAMIVLRKETKIIKLFHVTTPDAKGQKPTVTGHRSWVSVKPRVLDIYTTTLNDHYCVSDSPILGSSSKVSKWIFINIEHLKIYL